MEWLYYTCVSLWWYPGHLLAISLIPLADENKKQKTLFSSCWWCCETAPCFLLNLLHITYGVCLTLDCCCCCFSGNQLNMYETNCSFGVPILLLLKQHRHKVRDIFFSIVWKCCAYICAGNHRYAKKNTRLQVLDHQQRSTTLIHTILNGLYNNTQSRQRQTLKIKSFGSCCISECS